MHNSSHQTQVNSSTSNNRNETKYSEYDIYSNNTDNSSSTTESPLNTTTVKVVQLENENSPVMRQRRDTNTTTPPVVGIPSNHCPVLVFIEEESLPSADSVTMTNCGNQSECEARVMSPDVGGWTYIAMEIDTKYSLQEVTFDVHFQIHGKLSFFIFCQSWNIMLKF